MGKYTNEEKPDFQNDYWYSATKKFDDDNHPLLPYSHINYEIKKIKNSIGNQLGAEVIKTKKQVIDCGEDFHLGEKGISNFYSQIEDALKKELMFYDAELKIIERQCLNFIEFKDQKADCLETFFLEKEKSWHRLEDLIDFIDINMNGAYHLLRKLEWELHDLNRDVWQKFLNQNSDPHRPYVRLARAGEVLKFIEVYKLNLELLELNKFQIIGSDLAGDDKNGEAKIFDKYLFEFEQHLETIQDKYEHHRRIWLRGNEATNDIDFEDKAQYEPELKLKSLLIDRWVELLKNVEIPNSAKEIHHKGMNKALEMAKSRRPMAESACYNDRDAWMVIVHTMGFMLIYYGNVTTAYTYAGKIGFPKALKSIVAAATPFASFISTFHYAAWIKKKYTSSYWVSLITLSLGCFAYFIALTVDFPMLLLVGRILFGYGGGRVITKTFVTYIIKPKFKSLWSSYLVCMTALAITGGPGVSSLLEYLGSGSIFGIKYETYNIYSGVLTLILLAFSIFMLATFEDIPASRGGRLHKKKKSKKKNKPTPPQSIANQVQPALFRRTSTLVQLKREADEESSDDHNSNIQSFEYSDVDVIEHSQSEEIKDLEDPQFKGLNIMRKTTVIKQYFPLYFLFCIFTICKMTQEACIVEVPYLLQEYHKWTTQQIGFAIAVYTPFTIALALLPGILAMKGVSNTKMMIVFATMTMLSMFLKVNYSVDQPIGSLMYIMTSGVTLSLTFATEVTMTALFSEWQPYYIKKTFWNAGLLSGLGDTAGKTLGNFSITLFSAFGGTKALPFYMWATFIPIWIVSLVLILVNLNELKIIPRARVCIKPQRLKRMKTCGERALSRKLEKKYKQPSLTNGTTSLHKNMNVSKHRTADTKHSKDLNGSKDYCSKHTPLEVVDSCDEVCGDSDHYEPGPRPRVMSKKPTLHKTSSCKGMGSGKFIDVDEIEKRLIQNSKNSRGMGKNVGGISDSEEDKIPSRSSGDDHLPQLMVRGKIGGGELQAAVNVAEELPMSQRGRRDSEVKDLEAEVRSEDRSDRNLITHKSEQFEEVVIQGAPEALPHGGEAMEAGDEEGEGQGFDELSDSSSEEEDSAKNF